MVYLDAYTTALKSQPFQLIYVDAFAGEGSWRPGSEYATDDYAEYQDMLKGIGYDSFGGARQAFR